MATSKQDIREWLERGKAEGATHVIVVCDTFDHEDYPVFVKPGENIRDRVRSPGEMQRVMEVYAIHDDWDKQLNQFRCFNYSYPSTASKAIAVVEKTKALKKSPAAKKVAARKGAAKRRQKPALR